MTNSIILKNSLKTEAPGFGDYALPEGQSFDQMQTAAKAQKIVFAILFGILAISSIALVQISVPLAILISVKFSLLMVKSIVETMGVANRAPPMMDLFPLEKLAELPKLNELCDIPCSGFPTQDGPDSQKWKEELIKSARHSIVLSGCYCGGRVFDQTLNLIAKQMHLFPTLKTFILASEILITNENKTRINEIKNTFSDRFTCLVTPELFPYQSPTNNFSLTSNHTKALIIDYGAYFMLGGTGIVSSFAEQKGIAEPTNLEVKTGCLGQALETVFKMRAFRDMDFVFHSEINGIGTRLHVEMMKLIERMRHQMSSEIITPTADWPIQMEAICEAFEQIVDKADGLRIACYATGPEQENNPFLEEMVDKTDSAQRSIQIENLYFHPPKQLLNALIRASNRGVNIVILTNKNGSKSPGSHALYTQRSRYHSRQLFEGHPKANITLFEYEVPYTSLHKKIMVIDENTTFIGSANLGMKSLKNLDYEMNLKVESETFATQVAQAIESDKAYCVQVPTEEAHEIPFITPCLSALQYLPMIFG